MENKFRIRLRNGEIRLAAAAILTLATPLCALAAKGTMPVQAEQQRQIVVKGKVVDKQTKEGLIGASVTVKGLTTGAVTDINATLPSTYRMQRPRLWFRT